MARNMLKVIQNWIGRCQKTPGGLGTSVRGWVDGRAGKRVKRAPSETSGEASDRRWPFKFAKTRGKEKTYI